MFCCFSVDHSGSSGSHRPRRARAAERPERQQVPSGCSWNNRGVGRSGSLRGSHSELVPRSGVGCRGRIGNSEQQKVQKLPITKTRRVHSPQTTPTLGLMPPLFGGLRLIILKNVLNCLHCLSKFLWQQERRLHLCVIYLLPKLIMTTANITTTDNDINIYKPCQFSLSDKAGFFPSCKCGRNSIRLPASPILGVIHQYNTPSGKRTVSFVPRTAQSFNQNTAFVFSLSLAAESQGRHLISGLKRQTDPI